MGWFFKKDKLILPSKEENNVKSENSYYDYNNSVVDDKKIDVKEIMKENESLKKEQGELFLNLLKSRRSIRKFSDTKVDDKIIYDIINSATNAPCVGNLQNYKIIIVEDSNVKNKIAQISYEQYWIKTAPVVLVITRDDNIVESLYPIDGKKYSIQNVAALIENLIMAIHSKNLGTTWIGSTENEILKDFLGIPSVQTIDAILPIGYPEEKPEIQKTAVEELVFYEKYFNRIKPKKFF